MPLTSLLTHPTVAVSTSKEELLAIAASPHLIFKSLDLFALMIQTLRDAIAKIWQLTPLLTGQFWEKSTRPRVFNADALVSLVSSAWEMKAEIRQHGTTSLLATKMPLAGSMPLPVSVLGLITLAFNLALPGPLRLMTPESSRIEPMHLRPSTSLS